MNKKHIISTEDYLINFEVGNKTVQIPLNADDVAQIDSYIRLIETFRDTKKRIDKRLTKKEKEFDNERVMIAQTVKILREELEVINEQIDETFGEGKAQELFNGRLMIGSYIAFFEGLSEEIDDAIDHSQKELNNLVDKYDLGKQDDEEVL